MTRQNPNRIAELRLARRLNQHELAEAVKAHKITISKLERGEMRLTQDWMERLGSALGVSPAELLADAPLTRSVYINGSITDKVDLLGEGDFREFSDIQYPELSSVKFEINLGTNSSDESLHFFAETEVLGPGIQAGDVLRFTSIDVASSNLDKALGRFCIIETDEPRSMLFGILENGSSAGHLDLRLPAGGRRRGISPQRVFVLNLVIGLPAVLVDEEGVPL